MVWFAVHRHKYELLYTDTHMKTPLHASARQAPADDATHCCLQVVGASPAVVRCVCAGTREVERSALVNEEIVYFIFQLELDAQLQRALNYEAYEAAQQIRSKRETVGVMLCCAAEG